MTPGGRGGNVAAPAFNQGRKIMNTLASIATAALLAAGLNVAFADDLGAQPFVDSTGGSSQARGELVKDTAHAPSHHAARSCAPGETAVAPADSTGDSSATRAECLLDHARATALPGVATSTRNRYQPFLDSTGGNSQASSERALDAEAAATSHRVAAR